MSALFARVPGKEHPQKDRGRVGRAVWRAQNQIRPELPGLICDPCRGRLIWVGERLPGTRAQSALILGYLLAALRAAMFALMAGSPPGRDVRVAVIVHVNAERARARPLHYLLFDPGIGSFYRLSMERMSPLSTSRMGMPSTLFGRERREGSFRLRT